MRKLRALSSLRVALAAMLLLAVAGAITSLASAVVATGLCI